jgi:hypothetical protein
MPRPRKHKLDLNVAAMYCGSYECGEVYVGQTGRSTEIKYKEPRCILLNQTEKSSVAEHKLETGHNTDFSSTSILDRAKG